MLHVEVINPDSSIAEHRPDIGRRSVS